MSKKKPVEYTDYDHEAARRIANDLMKIVADYQKRRTKSDETNWDMERSTNHCCLITANFVALMAGLMAASRPEDMHELHIKEFIANTSNDTVETLAKEICADHWACMNEMFSDMVNKEFAEKQR